MVDAGLNRSREEVSREASPAPSGQFLATSERPDGSAGFKRNSDTQLLVRDQCISSAKTSKYESPNQVEKKSRKSFNIGKAEGNALSHARIKQASGNVSQMRVRQDMLEQGQDKQQDATAFEKLEK